MSGLNSISAKPSAVVFIGDSICSGFGLFLSNSDSSKDNFAAVLTRQQMPNVPYRNRCFVMATAADFIKNIEGTLFSSSVLPILRDELSPDSLQSGTNPIFFIELGGNNGMLAGEALLDIVKSTAKGRIKKDGEADKLGKIFPLENRNAIAQQVFLDLDFTPEQVRRLTEMVKNGMNVYIPQERAKASLIVSNCAGGYRYYCDFMDETLFKKGYEMLLKGLKDLYPQAQFVLMSVPHRVGAKYELDAFFAHRFSREIREMEAKIPGTSFIDLEPFIHALEGGLYQWHGKNYSMSDILQEDGIHPNKTGHQMLADYIMGQMSVANTHVK